MTRYDAMYCSLVLYLKNWLKILCGNLNFELKYSGTTVVKIRSQEGKMKNKINRGESGYIPAISLAFISELIWLMLLDHWLFRNLLLIRVKSLHLAYNLKHFTWSLAISSPSLCQSARSHGHTGKNCKSTILFPSLVMFVWCSRLMRFLKALVLKIVKDFGHFLRFVKVRNAFRGKSVFRGFLVSV